MQGISQGRILHLLMNKISLLIGVLEHGNWWSLSKSEIQLLIGTLIYELDLLIIRSLDGMSWAGGDEIRGVIVVQMKWVLVPIFG